VAKEAGFAIESVTPTYSPSVNLTVLMKVKWEEVRSSESLAAWW
jgi:hypothetical protein